MFPHAPPITRKTLPDRGSRRASLDTSLDTKRFGTAWRWANQAEWVESTGWSATQKQTDTDGFGHLEGLVSARTWGSSPPSDT